MSELGPGCLDGSMVEIAKGKMACIGGAHCVVWFTSLNVDGYEGRLEACSIFLLDSRNMGHSFIR
jgi:hypothetical protein